MSTWAYRCRPCDGEGEWWVARDVVAEMPPGVSLLRVHADGDWRCARVDRRQAVAVDGALLRDAVAASAEDHQRYAPAAASPPAPPPASAPTSAAAAAVDSAGPQVQAAAISVQGVRMVVVLVPLDVLGSPGEADMLATDLRVRLGGVDVVLMGQADDGSAQYHGDAALLALLDGVPVDRMPWQALHLG